MSVMDVLLANFL